MLASKKFALMAICAWYSRAKVLYRRAPLAGPRGDHVHRAAVQVGDHDVRVEAVLHAVHVLHAG
ncbi:MAG: hypothetical protein U0325_30130 [Polyangiales bacterium]